MSSSKNPNSSHDNLNTPPNLQRPVRLLIIQMTRLGDTLQSLMALRAAKQLYPHLEIHFLARERFASAAKRVPWLESVITFPSEKVLGPLMQGKATEREALQELARWVSPLVRQPWDMIINWSYSESSSFLTGLLPAKVKLGYSRSIERTPAGTQSHLSSPDGWSHYIQAVVQGGIPQNIHLTDILTTQLLTALQIHYGDPANNGDAPVTSKSFFTLNPHTFADNDLGPRWRDRTKKWIGIQLGAGQAEKTWDPENWAGLACKILDQHPEYGVILLGGKEEKDRGTRMLSAMVRLGYDPQAVISLVGRSDFDLWASVVSRCHWVFSTDTAAVHLASVLGTRVLNISVGPVRWAETGPYGNGHYIVAAGEDCPACLAFNGRADGPPSTVSHSCREQVTPEAAYGTWSYAIQDNAFRNQMTVEQHFSRLGIRSAMGSPGGAGNTIRIFRSRIRGTQDGGGVVYEPLISASLLLSDWTSMVMGHIARAWYCGWVPSVGQELKRGVISPGLIQKLRELSESSEAMSKICDEAARTATILNARSSRLRSDKIMRLDDRNELQELGRRMMEMEGLLERLGRTSAPLLAFAQMAKVLMHNLSGTQLSELGRESAVCYQQLSEGIGILREWVRHTLSMAKPVALRAEPAKLVETPV